MQSQIRAKGTHELNVHLRRRSEAGGKVHGAVGVAVLQCLLCGEGGKAMVTEIGGRVTAEGKRIIQAAKIFLTEILRGSLLNNSK